ncbi:MAG: uncharacterized protein PWQ51_1460 [Methanolobus sp.]|jgi:uncharacterized protein (UPF0179 family)|uniref:UPF0179 protein MettiDRAFT_2488 n=1 Tax=Methanolobus tindarius DSM 2278 TaxID=1090322 RepID=W9DT69_METTI|nr:UPF0179 family protein [Methanolobus tindarius]ETA68998.1 hypothetical protein MettiDRAFT_2488 [Methanolobus tindarius DSM 2278]MDI3485942.1 uncharacterized protein [Methanolobus sp.]MDK2939296.1 uncharacterized protein [Methanolobus sp.]
MTNDTTITLIGSRLAKEGEDFVFMGESRECKKCKLRRTCMNLEPGRKYRVAKIRGDTVHECFIHEGGVLTVDVETSPIVAAIESRKAVVGSKVSYELPKCKEFDDSVYDILYPEGLKEGDKCTVIKVLGPMEEGMVSGCSLKKVELKL